MRLRTLLQDIVAAIVVLPQEFGAIKASPQESVS